MISPKLTEKLTHERYFPCSLSLEDKTHVGAFRGSSLQQNPRIVIIGGEDTGVSYQLASVTNGLGKYIHCYGSGFTATHRKFWSQNNIDHKIEAYDYPFELISSAHEQNAVQLLYFGTHKIGLKNFIDSWAPNISMSIALEKNPINNPPVIIIDTNYVWGHKDKENPLEIAKELESLLDKKDMKMQDLQFTRVKPKLAKKFGYLYDLLNNKEYPYGRLLSFSVAKK